MRTSSSLGLGLGLTLLLTLAACSSSDATPSDPSGSADAGGDVATLPADAGTDAAPTIPKVTVTSTGSLQVPRANHTATRLTDGRVLVVGGEDIATRTPLASVEAWDPATGKWSELPDLPAAVVGHTATLLKDGRVLIAGAARYSSQGLPTGEGVSDAAWVIDPSTGVATSVGPMKHKRGHHVATLLGDGKVLLAGGTDAGASSTPAALDSAEIFDPTAGTFSEEATMTSPRQMAQAVALDGDHVLVVSGMDSGGELLETSEIYDHTTHAFGSGPTLPLGGRVYHTALHTSDGRTLVAGGVQFHAAGPLFLDDVEVSTGADFKPGPTMPLGRNSAPLIETSAGILAIGGFSFDVGGGVYFRDVLLLQDNAWVKAGSLKLGRFAHTATLLSDGRVLVAGGANTTLQGTCEILSMP